MIESSTNTAKTLEQLQKCPNVGASVPARTGILTPSSLASTGSDLSGALADVAYATRRVARKTYSGLEKALSDASSSVLTESTGQSSILTPSSVPEETRTLTLDVRKTSDVDLLGISLEQHSNGQVYVQAPQPTSF